MNYLAHAYLSFNQPAVLAGNLFSDFVKGKQQLSFPDEVRKGIILHRAIDAFTDDHAANKQAANIFKPYYRLYSAAFIDVAYDHFLANDLQQFTDDSLSQFSKEVYTSMDDYLEVFPERFKVMYPYMKQQNWLYNYRSRLGIERSFAGLVRRSAYMTESDTAFKIFEDNYDALQVYYADFFPALQQHALKMLHSLK